MYKLAFSYCEAQIYTQKCTGQEIAEVKTPNRASRGWLQIHVYEETEEGRAVIEFVLPVE